MASGGTGRRRVAARAAFWLTFATLTALLMLVAGCEGTPDSVHVDNDGWNCVDAMNRAYGEGYQKGRADALAGVEVLPPRPHELGIDPPKEDN